MPDQPSLEEPVLRECGSCGSPMPAELSDENCPSCGVPPGEEPESAGAATPPSMPVGGTTGERAAGGETAPAGSEPAGGEDSTTSPPAEEPEPEAPPRCPECKRFLKPGKRGWTGHKRECPRKGKGPDEPASSEEAKPEPPTTEETIDAAATEVLGPAAAREQPKGEIELYKPDDLTVASSEDVFRVMDRADEEQILEELQDRLTGVMVYSFEQDGQKITDLSYEGISECARTLNARGFTRMRVAKDVKPQVEEISEDGERFYRVAVYVEDERTGGGDWGIATEPKRMQLKAATAARWRKRGKEALIDADNKVWDKFALTKALSKAKRNAYRSQIPLKLRQVLIAQFLGDPSKVRTLRAATGAEAVNEMPAPLVTPEAEEKRDQARQLFAQIREVHPTAYMLPGQFNALLVRHEHDLKRLDEFIEQLKGLLARARKEQEKATTEADNHAEGH